MPTKKPTPGVKVYFPDKESQELLKRLRADAKKYNVSLSKFIFFAIEFGLVYLEESFEDMQKRKP